ncbi:DNA topoisomerase (ATP-hydrolyzing) subunit B [Prevotella sp. P4-51]|jgi:DNA gyrase subunit B|uniref:DNA topoisomerase (ATP-hydrolyzing) subunit B n=3 Tax=Prevotellaceae TaxID=171552 RepID=UPI000B976DAF|nr:MULTISPECIES: DNA topoisomerase (ATP-hydrolyzing) subunit B [Prevotella]HAG32973.1 DNA topoisomerase (ATP-hydrolyzing) subunit B [Prevotella sp.]MCF2636814.1 DNA topoisomerase (ATP-hydrolyzing) subunit B [Prevotella dentalis]OYP66130.1 DNA topoisomerase (ATP-hydrolyzing) subunit B [Prevotella sp. P5-64]OYP67620.1 DNA topoisomerase (ATP-hydrolyzing) subunit B [Prevotella sp. P5-108]OYP71912.1 DNA topoisomerase (ATP-hydrolyzing) subunit B [Prevotella sp. P4-51]
MEDNHNIESNYSASNIQVLEGLEAVRKRPAMYIGDISEKGLHHLINETVDNSIDEAMAGYCTDIEVTINEDNSVTVEDNGRGIPVDMHEKLHKSALEVVMTVLHAGGKFDKGSYKVSGGLHGVGVSCVNALSSHMMSQVFRNGKIYQQEYEKGKPLYPVKVVGETDKRGTRQQFWPDGSIFTTTTFQWDIVARRMRELAFLNAGIRITLTDARPDAEGKTRQEVFHAKDGLKEFVRYVDRHRAHLFDDVIYLKTEKQGIPIEVAIMYNTDYSENIHSYVNNINTIEGGTHLTGFRTALTRVLKAYADNEPTISKQIEKAKIEIAGEDFREGLTAVISIKVAEPQFEGQTKTKLGNSEVAGAVQQAVGEALNDYLEEHPVEAKRICEKVVLAATARIAARKARESVQRKNVMSGGGLPGKLADCSNKDPKECEIFLVEGDSAGGSAKQGRDRFRQAILPLRGKILNVEKVQWHRVFEAESVMNIIQSIGVRFGVEGEDDREANIDKLRYDKIIIMTDADVDGSHIDTLIMTLFYRFMPKVIEDGHLYIATPPLYRCSYKDKSEYCYTEQQRLQFIEKYAGGNDSDKALHTQRYKGLGEMNPEQLWETTMNPESRLLKQVTIENAADADEIFSMLMGDDVEPRRIFIEENATYANIDA